MILISNVLEDIYLLNENEILNYLGYDNKYMIDEYFDYIKKNYDFDEIGEDYEYDIDRDFEEDLAGPMNYEVTGDSFKDEVDEDEMPDFMEKLNESLDMFKRFKKYN
jgi:hypothetical protein